MNSEQAISSRKIERKYIGGVKVETLYPMGPELPCVTAETSKLPDPGQGTETKIFIGGKYVGVLRLYRGPSFAARAVRGVLKGIMSRLGRHRRMTANRAARKAAERGVA